MSIFVCSFQKSMRTELVAAAHPHLFSATWARVTTITRSVSLALAIAYGYGATLKPMGLDAVSIAA